MLSTVKPNSYEMDPGLHLPNNDNPTDMDQDFQAIGPALRILQLNVEGLSAAKRSVISPIADRQKIDIICLQETHVNVDEASLFSIKGFDLVCYALHSKHGRATYVRSDIAVGSSGAACGSLSRLIIRVLLCSIISL